MRCSQRTTKGTALPKRLLLVSKDLGEKCFLDHINDIVTYAEDEKCETIMLALHSINDDGSRIRLQPAEVFGETTKYPATVILEVGSLEKEVTYVEVFSRDKGRLSHRRFVRHFATSTAGRNAKQKLVEEFQRKNRHIGNGQALVICGESNVIKTMRSDCSYRGARPIADEFEFLKLLKKTKTKVVLNPWHTWCRRPEANWKRAAMSDGRIFISVWNTWKGVIRGEAKIPWVVFKDGENITAKVREIPALFSERPDIRIGVLQC